MLLHDVPLEKEIPTLWQRLVDMLPELDGARSNSVGEPVSTSIGLRYNQAEYFLGIDDNYYGDTFISDSTSEDKSVPHLFDRVIEMATRYIIEHDHYAEPE